MSKLQLATAVVIASLAIFAQPAKSQSPAWCGGFVTTSWVETGGRAYISGDWRGDHTQICNVKETWKGVTPDVCLTWLAKVDSAVALGRPVTVYYSDVPDCATIPSYGAAPAPYYIMLQ